MSSVLVVVHLTVLYVWVASAWWTERFPRSHARFAANNLSLESLLNQGGFISGCYGKSQPTDLPN